MERTAKPSAMRTTALVSLLFLLGTGLGSGLGCGARTPLGGLDGDAAAPSPDDLDDEIVGLAVGDGHACAVRADGRAVCWGEGGQGQIGDGAREDRTTPSTVSGLVGAVEIAAGGGHTCARTQAGRLRCWGSRTVGQLGDGLPLVGAPAEFGLTPADVPSISAASQVAAGDAHTCARVAGGAVRCFGINDTGELGDGELERSSVARPVAGITGATQIALGASHGCARLGDGAVECWGSNEHSQLGRASSPERCGGIECSRTPIAVPGLSGVVELALASNRTCARLSSGDVRCWGFFADGVKRAPTEVPGLGRVERIAIGRSHACALRVDGAVVCWGEASRGQLGRRVGTACPRGTGTCDLVPRPVPGLGGVKALAAGGDSTCALLDDGEVRCWGRNDHGQLGDGTKEDRFEPTRVTF